MRVCGAFQVRLVLSKRAVSTSRKLKHGDLTPKVIIRHTFPREQDNILSGFIKIIADFKKKSSYFALISS